jgi:hypothetical protein
LSGDARIHNHVSANGKAAEQTAQGRMFYAVDAEAVHVQLPRRSKQQWKDLGVRTSTLPTCGYIEFGKAPGKCHLRRARNKFIKG